jgi:hypothetical protein
MMTSLRVLSLVTVAALAGPLSYARNTAQPSPKALCAGYSTTGTSAEVELVTGSVNLRIIEKSGRSTTLNATQQSDADDCRVFFNSKGDLLTVAIRKRSDLKQTTRLLVADTVRLRWVSDFALNPQAGLQAPLSPVGFLRDSQSIVVEDYGQEISQSPPTTAIRTIIVDLLGKSISQEPYERAIAGNIQNQREEFADPAHNRLWYPSYPDFCPIRSTTLTGKQTPGPEINNSVSGEQFDCLPDVIAYPDDNTLIMAATLSDRDTVWRVDLGATTGEKIPVPRGRFPNGDQIDGNGSLSPDGQVFAFSRHQFSYGHFDNFSYKGSDIVVVQVRPLRVLGVIDPKGSLYQHGFAVDHRDGNTTVLVFSEGTWKRLAVAAPKPGGRSAALDPKDGTSPTCLPEKPRSL